MRASESDRGVLCPASLVLPRTRIRSEKTIRAADWGTLVHHWKETGETDPPWANEKDVDLLERKLLATGVRRETLWRGGHHEVSFALNLETLRVEKFMGARDKADAWKAAFGVPPPPRLISPYLTGTIDWYDGCADWLEVNDLKTGAFQPDPMMKQLVSYALFIWIYDGYRPTTIGRSITWWPKYPIDGQPRQLTAPPITALELEEHLDDLQHSVRNPHEINPTEDGCRFCDSRPNCPVYTLEEP